jgi:hypothetical protein
MPESYRDEQRRLLDELAVSGGDTMLDLGGDLGLGRRRRRRRRRQWSDQWSDLDPSVLPPSGLEEDSTSTAGFPMLQWLSDRVDTSTDTQTAVGEELIAASDGDRTPDVRPYVPRPSNQRSFEDPFDPFAEPPSKEDFQQMVAWSHLRGALNPIGDKAVRGLASLLGFGAGVSGIGALSFLKPSYTDPTAIEIGRLTDIIDEEPGLRTNPQQLMERAQGLRPLNPPPIWEVEQLQNAQREQQAAAEQATIMAQIGAQAPTMQDQFALLSGGQDMAVDPGLAAAARVAPPVAPPPAAPFGLDFTAVDPGQAAPSFDLEAALAIAGITPESWGG